MMINPFEANKNEATTIRSENENDRSIEFKEKRNELVMSINDYLAEIAKKEMQCSRLSMEHSY